MLAVERLKERALALDAPGLEAVLRGLDDEERASARAWVLADKTFFETVRQREPDYRERERDLHGAAPWLRTMCVVWLCSPVEAARAIRWADIWGHMTPVARELATRLIADRPREWAEAFLAATAGLRLSSRAARDAGDCLAWLVARGLADHELPCPGGATFLESYLRDGWRDQVDAECLRRERLVPGLVYLMIEAGVAANLAALHEAVPELVADGTLDRDRLISACLEALTAGTRVGSQRVVAKVLAALDLRPEEVPGGLAFLTGVIATRDGSVGAVLLPRALALVTDATGLEELTRVVAGRKERKQKQTLLAELRDPASSAAAGLDGVLRALEVLAAGQEDASLLRGIEAARSDLGAPVDPSEKQAEVLGLWMLDLEPGPAREWPWWLSPERFGVRRFLDRRSEAQARAFEYTVDGLVRELAEGGPSEFVRLCHRLRVDGNLALTRFNSLLEPVFLAGGLRLLWPSALEVADDVASANRVLPGLPELLRLLTRYAAEVPDGWALPPHLARLAAAPGGTKTQLESRALGAALARVDAADFAAEPTPAAATPTRGLWELRPPGSVLARLLDPYYPHYHWVPDSQLQYTLSVGNGIAERRRDGHSAVLLMDTYLLRYLAEEVQTLGLDVVRTRVAAAPRVPGTDSGPTARAIAMWQAGALTPESFDDVLAADRTAGPGLDRVVFAWTCEQLVRLATHPGLLSHPSRTDGSVLPARVVDRIRSYAGIAKVGPLDLLLTLTRLQVKPAEKQEALQALAGLELWTDPLVTRTTDGVDSFDVVPVLREWIEAGGSSGTRVPVDLGLFTDLTEQDLWGPASHPDVLRRVWPRHPGLPQPEPIGTYQDRALVVLQDGHLPVDSWRRMLADTFTNNSTVEERALSHIVQLARYDGVLDAEVTVPAALSRFAAGHLPLARFGESLQWLFERGGLRQLWPLGLAVAAAAAARSRKPSGLPFLLSSLASYAPEVPTVHRAVPSEIAALAASAGSTKSHAAARDLVVALGVGEMVMS